MLFLEIMFELEESSGRILLLIRTWSVQEVP